MKLDGRFALITGASQGLGLAIAKAYVREGASVMICARDVRQLESSAKLLNTLKPSNSQQIAFQCCDISDEQSVDNLVECTLSDFPNLEILVNNAGIYGPFGNIEEVDWKEWKKALAINLFGPIYLCHKMMPHFRKKRYGKIINVSGGGATTPLPGISSYATAKAGLVRFCETLALEAKKDNIDVNAIAPGALATRMMDQVVEASPTAVGQDFINRMKQLRESGGTPLEVGAECVVHLGSAPSDGITGRLISAVWDPWETLDRHRADIDSTDVYTIRRIVPAERGFDWGDREEPAG
jgi:3-oxoacyl-[acyl-carrier protein] reductase